MSTTNCLSHPDPLLSLNLTIWFLKSFLKLHPGNQILMQIKRHLKKSSSYLPHFWKCLLYSPRSISNRNSYDFSGYFFCFHLCLFAKLNISVLRA